jgi:hypothetical protein
VIATRSARRWLNVAGVGSVIGLMSYALYEQYVVGLEACPLCILQPRRLHQHTPDITDGRRDQYLGCQLPPQSQHPKRTHFQQRPAAPATPDRQY